MNVHLWRGRVWRQLSALEARKGDALRVMNDIGKSLDWYAGLKRRREPTPDERHKRALNIMYFAAELTDHIIKREVELGIGEPWNDRYVKVLLHFWRKIPHDLRREIIALSPRRGAPGGEK